MFVRALAMRLKARAVTTKIDTNSHKSAVDHRARETSSLSCQKACGIQRGFDTAEVNRAGDGRRVYDPVGDVIHQGIQDAVIPVHPRHGHTVAHAVHHSLNGPRLTPGLFLTQEQNRAAALTLLASSTRSMR